MRFRIALVLTLAAATVALGGCAQIEKSLTPAPKITSREATVAAVGVQVTGSPAEGLPTDLPLWPRATVDASAMTEAASGKVYELTLSTGDAYKAVLDGMAVGLQKQGWSVSVSDASSADLKGSSLSITKGGASGMVTISETATGSVTIDYVVNLAE